MVGACLGEEGWYVVIVTDLNGRPLPSKMWDGGGG